MANFDKFIPHLLKCEGGYVNHPYDRGGCTNKGITIGVYRSRFGDDKTCEDLKNITDAEAAKIYKSEYWDKCKADYIVDEGVAYLIADWAVNSGVKTAIKEVQKLIGTTPDGIVGNVTLRAINRHYGLYDKIMERRVDFYENIAKNRPTQQVFLKGWLNRLKLWDEYINDLNKS